MNRIRVIMIGLVILAVTLSGCGIGAEEPTPTPLPEQAFASVVSVTGEVVPTVWTRISAQTGGTVLELPVEPGDEVAAGDLLILLDQTDAELEVRRAERALEAARARLALLQADPLAEEVAVAEAQIEAAEAALSRAAAQRDQITAGAPEAEIAAALAQVTVAQADRFAAHEIHEQTMKCYEFTLPGGQEESICPLLGPVEERARFNLQAAEEELDAAQAQLDALQAGADDRVRAVEAAVWAAAARRDVAQAELGVLLAGATAEEIATRKAEVTRARATLDAAQVTLERTEVRSPLAGTIGRIDVRRGEFVSPGQSLVTVGDLSTLRVETTDLDEIDVGRVEVGQRATVTFDALPDRTFGGQVTRISPMAESDAGGVNYTVIIEMDELAPEIRWGMTAFVDIEVREE